MPGQPLLLYLDRITALYDGMGALSQGATVPARLSPSPSRQGRPSRWDALPWWLTREERMAAAVLAVEPVTTVMHDAEFPVPLL